MKRRMFERRQETGDRKCPADRRHVAGGFTLIELLISMVVVGLAITGLMMANQSATTVNGRGRDMARATFLAQEIREYCFSRDIDDVVSASYTPPVDAGLTEVDGFGGWSQVVTAYYVDTGDIAADRITDVEDPDYIVYSDMKYVRCEVTYNGTSVLTTGWLVIRR